MSKADQFREYAEEAMRWARQSKTEKERQALIELACTWTQAAVQSEHIFGGNDSPPEARAVLWANSSRVSAALQAATRSSMNRVRRQLPF